MELGTDKMIAEKDGGIGWMTFNNPDRRNAISIEMRQAVLKILQDFESDDAVRVIVMKGAGDKAFVSGSDISQFEKNRATEQQQKEYAALSAQVQSRFDALHKPLIAMIQGYCLGAGLGTAMNADLRIAADDAQFGIPAARLSLGYPYNGIKRLVDLVGPSRTKDILFTARRLTADDALRIGLVDRVVPRAELEDTVHDIAVTIAENAPLTIRATKAIVAEVLKDPAERDLDLCERMVRDCMSSEDHVEGRRAFMEKRRPAFTGQ